MPTSVDWGALLLRSCETPDALHAWVKLFVGLDVPRVAVCDEHAPPFEYLRRSYFEPTTDLVVWAPRGGGKTRLAAVATLLDLLHKPGTQVRILGGSLEQSLKMWDYLLPDLHRLARKKLRQMHGKHITLDTGSGCAVLTQSQRSVRGLRVQKLRCDEVELFDPAVWEAAQLVTRSTKDVRGTVEALSTYHAVGGMMGKVIDDADAAGLPVVRWCLLDVLAKCELERSCDGCPLWEECQGRAKSSSGFVPIDDAIDMKRRVSTQTWESEMLCRRPSVRGCVFPTFDLATHVAAFEPGAGKWWLSVDFGFAAPFVVLWILQGDDGSVRVVDEYLQPQRTIDEHLDVIAGRGWPRVEAVTCDPAGAARVGQTATSDVAVLRSRGHVVLHRPSRIVDGLELIRRHLRAADGTVRLTIHPRCARLIEALRAYRYPDTGGELPIKDGVHDHPIDALRYWFINQQRREVRRRRY